MTIALDSTSGRKTAASATNLSYAHVCTGSDLILVVSVCLFGLTADDASVTYNGVAMTKVGPVSTTGSSIQYLFYLVNPATGSNTVSISSSASATVIIGFSTSYTGCAQSGQPDNSGTFSGSGTTIATTLTANASNCWAVAGLNNLPGFGISAGAGTTDRGNGSAQSYGDSNGPVSGSTTLNFTMGGSATGIDAVMLTIAPVAPPANSNFLMFMPN